MAILYADATRCSQLLYWGRLKGIDVDSDGTRYTVANLTPISQKKTQELVLRSTNRPIAKGFIRPYAIVWTPAFGGRSMLDLFHTLQELQAWDVSIVAQTGLQFDLRSAQGKLIASLMAALAEFERDLLRERVRSGIAAAKKRGVVFGRRPGQRVKADRFAPKVLKLVGEGQSYREISHRLGLSKNTVLDIVKRDRAA
jgi:hypothetical protein